jgi:hypothetical protein
MPVHSRPQINIDAVVTHVMHSPNLKLLRSFVANKEVQTVMGPIVSHVAQDYAQYAKGHQPLKNELHILCIVVVFLTAAVLANTSPGFKSILPSIASWFGINYQGGAFANTVLLAQLSSYVGSYSSEGLFMLICQCKYGHSKFFLTPERLQQLSIFWRIPTEDIASAFINLRNQWQADINTEGAQITDLENLMEQFMSSTNLSQLLANYNEHAAKFDSNLQHLLRIGETDNHAKLLTFKRDKLATATLATLTSDGNGSQVTRTPSPSSGQQLPRSTYGAMDLVDPAHPVGANTSPTTQARTQTAALSP